MFTEARLMKDATPPLVLPPHSTPLHKRDHEQIPILHNKLRDSTPNSHWPKQLLQREGGGGAHIHNQGHTYTQHRRDASLMHSRVPSQSRPHREEKATQT